MQSRPPRAPSIPRLASLVFAAAFTVPWTVTGCGNAGHAYCSKSCDCVGCSTSALQSCNLTADGNEKTANDIGCLSQYDAAAACAASQSQCIGSQFKVAGCDVEIQKANNCITSAKCHIGIDLAIHCP